MLQFMHSISFDLICWIILFKFHIKMDPTGSGSFPLYLKILKKWCTLFIAFSFFYFLLFPVD